MDKEETNTPMQVHMHNGFWWFWDETLANRIGPYMNELEAKDNMVLYANKL